MKQEARIISSGQFLPVEVDFIRDDRRMFTIPCKWREADVLASAWDSGATMARMAEILRSMGLKS